ncbi:MAG: hypothetical protein HY376_02890 [Candidatus Blackburnbacteria bacterium]|nr:hypothetical protein [Candidatus Blackburnbacteria bacterium]
MTILIDWFLMLASLILVYFGFYLMFRSSGRALVGLFLVISGGLLLIQAIVIDVEAFNPELHDCFGWESEDKYSNQNYDTCKIWAWSQKVGAEILCKREFFYNCVSWQPKPKQEKFYIEYEGKNYTMTPEQFVSFTNEVSYQDDVSLDALHECVEECYSQNNGFANPNPCVDGCYSTQRSEYVKATGVLLLKLNIIPNEKENCHNNPSDSDKCECVKSEIVPVEYYFRVFSATNNKTLDEIHTGGGNDAGLTFGIQQAGMSKRYYDQNTQAVRVEYWVSKRSEVCVEAVPR